ncbi:hypothetical protein Poli38472_001789 [Pythium oligandrum]|uniref:Amino acid permease/ SLC12A domain-containing protein n=1 Tax=Pythium oligandrum TaxID=41045 RepID=A0A8K1CVC9_PYTOL|nr:hypothetical protein Poli38472_001789 [Pythium oligandrum]|eukprot:TMW69633.1 hypothetical protein Poli38472_001789 [Pythium oligandrum]
MRKGCPVAPNASIIPIGATVSVEKPSKSKEYQPGKFQLCLIGYSIVLGGQYFGWNLMLLSGVYGCIANFMIISSAYIAYCHCVAEVSGTLPFAGGAYGLARCTLGFFPAFLVGCFQALQFMTGGAMMMLVFVQLTVGFFPILMGYEPIFTLCCYIFCMLVHVRGGHIFWGISFLLGFSSVGLLIVYFFGSLPRVDITRNALDDPFPHFYGGFKGLISYLPYGAWMFVGVETLNLASSEVESPKKTVSSAQVMCVWTLFFTAIMTIFSTISVPLPNGIFGLALSFDPLSMGFHRIFQVDIGVAVIFSLVPTFSVCFGFMWAYARVINAMARSKLFPPWLARGPQRYGTPGAAIVGGAAFGYGLSIAAHFEPELMNLIFITNLFFAFVSYIGQCIGYISLKVNYSIIKQSAMKNPFGIIGAVYSMIVWITCIFSLVILQKAYLPLILVIVISVIAALYYYLIARRRQTFSDEENKVLLTAHVSRFNARRAKVKPRGKGGKNKVSGPNRDSARGTNRGSGGGAASHTDMPSARNSTRNSTRLSAKQSVRGP